MITKVVFPDAYDFGTPPVSLVGFTTKGMEKRAALFDKDVPSIQKKANRAYLHVITTGAGEYYGANQNGDHFPERAYTHIAPLAKTAADREFQLDGGLMKYHDETYKKYGGVYHNHCFPAKSKVVTGLKNYRNIEALRVGDLVMTRGGARKILKTYKRAYEGPGITLKTYGERSITSTEDHPVFVIRREKLFCPHNYFILPHNEKHGSHCVAYRQLSPVLEDMIEVVPAKGVRVADWLLTKPYACGDTALSVAFARLIGWTAAEGHLSKDGFHIVFTFATKNSADIDDVLACLTTLGMHTSVFDTKYGTTQLNACSAEYHVKLSRYITGIKDSKTLKSTIFELSYASKLQMLGAYIDGDGSVTPSGVLRIRSSSFWMRRRLSELIESLGISAASAIDTGDRNTMISPTNGQTYDANPSGCVAVAPPAAGPLLTFSRKKRKKPLAAQRGRCYGIYHDGFILRRVNTVESVELAEPVYNIEVEEFNEYMVDGILVHNCNSHTKTASSGEIVLAKYNEPMHRGELLIGVDTKDWAPQLERLANGKPVYLSMAADVPFDISSCCHHIRRTPEDKCEHTKNGLLMLTKEGHQISLINDRPMFHDISEVFKPADKIAFTLRKVASEGVRSSDEIANEMGIHGLVLPLEIQKKATGARPGALSRRLALLSKLAKIEKTIEAKINPGDEAAKLAFSPEGGFGDVDDRTIGKLRERDPSAVFGAAKRGMVLLPVDVFLKLLTGDRFGSDIAPSMPSVRASMGGVFGRLEDSGSSCCDDAAYEPENVPDRGLEDIVGGLMGSHSLAPEPVRVRIIKVVMRGKPSDRAAMPKEAVSKLRTAASDYLAGEYAKYALAFLDGMPEDKARLTVAYTTGYSAL